MDFLAATFATLPSFLIYVAVAGALLAAFAALYLFITPYAELALIRRGNSAAGINFFGALLGFTLPLTSLIAHAINVIDLVLWSVVAAIVQIAAHFVARLFFHDFAERIDDGNIAVAIFAAAIAICFGMINAACLSY